MSRKDLLLARLDQIGASLERTGRALALIALGSAGRDLQRLDDYSDLDFFAIVKPGEKSAFLHDLSWLDSIVPIAYSYRNTPDGFKIFFEDGIFCEFAVFEPQELAAIPFDAGRIVWRAPGVDDSIAIPAHMHHEAPSSVEWLLGEALTNLYVGLCRYHRGEKLSAQRFIQQHAVGKVLDLIARTQQESSATADPFNPERRFEQRFPAAAEFLPKFIQGYELSRESALAILNYLDDHFEVQPFVKKQIRELCR